MKRFKLHTGGDQNCHLKLSQIESCSSDSLIVHIEDLANPEELNYISPQEKKDSFPFVEQSSDELIEDPYIINGFRLHSNKILDILNEKDRLPYLFKYGEKDSCRKLLAIAAEVGWYEGIVFLLNHGVNINETDRENRTALIDCLAATNTNILLALVKKPECNLDIQTSTGHTATHYTVMMNKISSFEILIKYGARLDLHNDKGENVLHQIIVYKRKKYWKIIKHYYTNNLIYLKSLINTETYEHKTCLLLAFEHHPKIYFFKELLPYIDKNLINIELFQSWSKAYKLLQNLFK